MGSRSGSSRPPAELSDDELLAEVVRRRRRRGLSVPEDLQPNRLSRVELSRHLAALELEMGATLKQVEQAYEALRAKYEPYAKVQDADRSAAAKKLLESLASSHEALRKHFAR